MINGIPSLSQPAAALANLALVSPVTNIGYQPISAQSFSTLGQAWYFHAEMDNDVSLEADVTDSYLEDNTAVQDHIVLKPEVVMVRAVVGEVTYLLPQLGAVEQQIQNILTVISDFAPKFSVSAQNVLNQTVQAYNEAAAAVNGAVSAYNSLAGNTGANVITGAGQIATSPTQTQQQALFSQIYGYWRQQASLKQPVLFNVQTPWAIFSPMALMSCKPKQTADTVLVTEFMLTFKMVRIVDDTDVSTVSIGRAANLSQPTVYNGNSTPKQGSDISTALPAGGF